MRLGVLGFGGGRVTPVAQGPHPCSGDKPPLSLPEALGGLRPSAGKVLAQFPIGHLGVTPSCCELAQNSGVRCGTSTIWVPPAVFPKAATWGSADQCQSHRTVKGGLSLGALSLSWHQSHSPRQAFSWQTRFQTPQREREPQVGFSVQL